MSGMTNYSGDEFLNYITGQQNIAALPAIYLGLLTAVGNDAGTGDTEVSGGAYARVQCAGTVATNGTTASGANVLHFASVPSWVGQGFAAFDLTATGAVASGTTVTSIGTGNVTLSANTGAVVGNGDAIAFSTFTPATGTGPASVQNSGTIGFPQATASWGTVIGFAWYDAPTGGDQLGKDYLGAYSWQPCFVSSASPGVFSVHAHGFSVGDPIIYSTEVAGAAPSFSQSNFTGVLILAHAATDTFDVTNAATAVNTSSTGGGLVRKIVQQPIAINTTFSFAPGQLVLTGA